MFCLLYSQSQPLQALNLLYMFLYHIINSPNSFQIFPLSPVLLIYLLFPAHLLTCSSSPHRPLSIYISSVSVTYSSPQYLMYLYFVLYDLLFGPSPHLIPLLAPPQIFFWPIGLISRS